MTKIQPGSIMVAADGSPDANRAVQWAAEQAALERRPLVVLSAAHDTFAMGAIGPGAAYTFSLDDLLAGARATASEAALLAARHRPGLSTETHAVLGNPRDVITDASHDAHLLVLGSRGRGPVRSKLLGSVSASVTKHAECPVVVCRPGTDLRVKRGVLVGADGTRASLPVIDFAFRQASLRDQPLTVVHAFYDELATVTAPHLVPDSRTSDSEHQLLVAESVAGFRERYPEVRVQIDTARGEAVETLATIADIHNLVVIGRHAKDSALSHAARAVSTALLERTHTNIAVVPEAAPADPE